MRLKGWKVCILNANENGFEDAIILNKNMIHFKNNPIYHIRTLKSHSLPITSPDIKNNNWATFFIAARN